ncbi:hypothetical protein [Hyphomicrobium sp.]|uniref:hypothetical protein n=1 Tax=Hyphomicrobium sp. TaxID=82 RepID=UPI0025BA3AD0|nr:hypothetical protein [Hyphomicrobium sp.]MCC7253674.1 hypothetical protein [Hyphomicrobium sp.]
MKRVIGSLLFLSLATASALAQDPQGKGEAVIGKQEGVKMAEVECQAAWEKANPSKKDKISAGQAQPFIADIAAANTNSDGSIDQSEFMAACDKGLMKAADSMKAPGSATTGSGAGTEGVGPADPNNK